METVLIYKNAMLGEFNHIIPITNTIIVDSKEYKIVNTSYSTYTGRLIIYVEDIKK